VKRALEGGSVPPNRPKSLNRIDALVEVAIQLIQLRVENGP